MRVSRLIFGAFCVVAGWLVFGVSAAVAVVPEAPEVVVEVPVHASEAVVRGVLFPGAVGEAGTYEFLYKEGGVCEGGSSAPQPPGVASGGEHEEVVETLGGLSPGSEYTVCVRVEDGGGATVGPGVTFTTALAPETPVTGPVTSITASSAVLEGVLNPNAVGNPGTYEFFYQESASECEGVAQNSTSAVAATGAKEEPAQAQVTELLPNAQYTFCLLARNEAGEEALGPAVTFTSAAIKPVIGSAAATSDTSSSVDLMAKIDPNGADTTYHLEYGTSISYGTSVPVPEKDIGAGRGDVVVSQHVVGLLAGRTYHWRVLATNAAGTETTPDQTFVYPTASGGLPDGREYELVTPPHKNGALIGALFNSPFVPEVADDGASAMAQSVQCFQSSESCVAVREQEAAPFEFARTGTGWVTRALAPPASRFPSSTIWGFDANEHTVLFSAPSPPHEQDDFYVRSRDGELGDIGPLGEGGPEGPNVGGGPTFRKLSSVEGTADFSHVPYSGQELWSFDGSVENESSSYAYAGVGSAEPVPVGVSGGQGATDLISRCSTVLASGEPSGAALRYGSASEDGRTVYFTASRCLLGGSGDNELIEVPANELYARIDGERSDAHTVHVSAPASATCKTVECQGAPASDAVFVGASNDGSRVFFTSEQQLTDQAGGGGANVYESECANHCPNPASERRLFDVSEGAKGTGGPRVRGVMAVSPDGSHVYFLAGGVLTSAPNARGQHAEEEANNLYVYTEGHVAFIATLPESDQEEWLNDPLNYANVTPGGRFLVFTSHAALTVDDTRAQGPAQVYRYDSETGALIRVSIGEQGFNDNGNTGTGDAGIVPAFHGFSLGDGPGRADPTMSHDAEYVFFESPVALAAGALDDVPLRDGHLAENVYEYHDGHVFLISDGKDITQEANRHGGSSVELLGSDATGANVFFTTDDQLTPQDTDTQRDYYDAHICSGAEPCPPTASPPPLPCQEEACHNPVTPAPQTPPAGSNTLQGPGNLPAPQALVNVTILTRAAHASKSFTLRIKIPAAGHLTITGAGTLKTSRTITTPGTYTLKITLTPITRRALHHKHKLTLKLHTTYTPTNNTTTTTNTTITLKT